MALYRPIEKYLIAINRSNFQIHPSHWKKNINITKKLQILRLGLSKCMNECFVFLDLWYDWLLTSSPPTYQIWLSNSQNSQSYVGRCHNFLTKSQKFNFWHSRFATGPWTTCTWSNSFIIPLKASIPIEVFNRAWRALLKIYKCWIPQQDFPLDFIIFILSLPWAWLQ